MKSIAPDKPFFLYVAPGANHSPHHAPQGVDRQVQGAVRHRLGRVSRIDTSRGRRSSASFRETRKLTARSEGLPAWDGLEHGQKRIYARMMEVIRRLCGARRPPHGPRHRRGEGDARRRQYHLCLHRGRQRRQRRGGTGGELERKSVFQRVPREVARQPEAHRRDRRDQSGSTTFPAPGHTR